MNKTKQNQAKLIYLSWDNLRPSALNVHLRGDKEAWASDDDLPRLSESILKEGIKTPLAVEKNGDGYVIIQGERRWRATKSLGDKAPPLPCIVVSLQSDTDRLVSMGTENIQRRNLTPIQEARYYQATLAQNSKLNATKLSQRLGVPPQRIRTAMRMLRMEPEIQKAMNERIFPSTELVLSVLERLKPEIRLAFVKKAVKEHRGSGEISLALEKLTQTKEAIKAANKVRRKRAKVAPNNFLSKILNRFLGALLTDSRLLDECAVALLDCDNYELSETAFARAKEINNMYEGLKIRFVAQQKASEEAK